MTVPGLDGSRVMEVSAPTAGGGGWELGSGYRVRPDLVLTAAHVVAGAPVRPSGEPVPLDVDEPGLCLARPLGTSRWVPAVVVWRDDKSDVAVLCSASTAPPLPPDSPPPRWGRVEGSDRVRVTAVGFPWAQKGPDGKRDTEQMEGFISPYSMAKAGLYAITVTSAAPSTRADGSPWSGMSGAALFAGDCLVGVFVIDPPKFGPDRLVAAPVAPLLADANFAALFGASCADVIPISGAQHPPVLAVDTLLQPPVMVGRADELKQLRAAAQQAVAGGRPLSILVVHGMGGAGKTALARRLAQEVASNFPDVRIEVDLYGFTPDRRPRPPGEVLEELLRLVGIAAADIPPTQDLRSEHWRRHLSTRRTLLVLDNARDAEQVLPLQPGGSHEAPALVVVTSRTRLADLDAACAVEAGTLAPDDAVDLLVAASRKEAAQMTAFRDDLEVLASLCGFLPLALRPVGSMLARFEPSRLVEDMCSAQYPLQDLRDADKAAAAAFTVSYQALDTALQDILRACAWHPGPDFDADSIAALVDQPPRSVRYALAELSDHNMLTESGRERYGFHDVLLVYARREAADHDDEDEARAAKERLCAHLAIRLDRAASRIWPDAHGPADVGVQTDDPNARDQARAWLSAAAEEMTTAARAALAESMAGSTVFASALAYWLHADGRFDQPNKLYQALREAASRAGLANDEAAALAGLGLVAHAHSEYRRAQEAFELSYQLYTQTDDRQAQADIIKRLADVARVLGDHERAEDGYRRAIDLYREQENRRGQADALTGLGDVAYLRGDPQLAGDAFQHAFELCEQIGYRSGQADALCGLGDADLLTGEPDSARGDYQRARDIYVDIGNVHGLAYALKGLGDAARALSDYPHARESYGQSLDLYEKIGFANCKADVLTGLGHVARAEDDDDEATDLFLRAYAISKEIGYRDGEQRAHSALQA